MTFWHTLRRTAGLARAFPDGGPEDEPKGDFAAGQSGIASDPVLWAEKLLGFTPDAAQAEILRSAASRLMLCCTRQFGKSTITAIKALQHAWTRPNSLVLIAAPTARQAGEWLEKSRRFLAQLGVRGRADGINRLSLKLPNGSRLVGLPDVPDNVRGFSKASLVLIDEAAFVADELYHALNPMLAVSRGGLWLMSTPGAQSGFFYEEWSRESATAADSTRVEAPLPDAHERAGQSAEAGSQAGAAVAWTRYRITAGECPRIPAEFLAEQRILLGDAVYRREYECEFVAAGTQIIGRDLVDDALDAAMLPFNGGKPLWR